jgi:hypothetical protein
MPPSLDPRAAYQADLAEGHAPFCDDDGSIVVVASMIDQIAHSPDADPRTILNGANRLAVEILQRRFPEISIPRTAPGLLSLGPPLALGEAIKNVLPNLANHLVTTTLTIILRERGPTPDTPVFGGLPTSALMDLTGGDWVRTGAFRISGKHLDAKLLDRSDLLHDARRFLLTLRDHGPVKVTKTYDLSREAVALLRPKLRLSRPLLDDPLLNVIIDEVDDWLLVQRRLLQAMRLVVYRNRQLHISKKGVALLVGDRRGELLALLFIALFGESDLRILDRSEQQQYRGLSASLPICFYLIGRHATDWISAEAITDATWLPTMRDEPENPHARLTKLQQLTLRYRARVLRPLVAFGLLEERKQGGASDPRPEFRITPLFYALLRFEVSTTAGPPAPISVTSRLVQ